MEHAATIGARFSEIGLQCEPWGEHRMAVLCQAQSGEDVMIVVNEPRRFGPYFITEIIWGRYIS